MARILFLSPTYYDEDSVIGGSERYVHELATEIGKTHTLRLVCFGSQKMRKHVGTYERFIYPSWQKGVFSIHNPVSLTWWQQLWWADLVHAFQISTLQGDIATLLSNHRQVPFCMTDNGGGSWFILHKRFPNILQGQQGIGHSRYAVQRLRDKGMQDVRCLPGGIRVPSGIVDLPDEKTDEIVFVGRLLEHKGPHLILDAMRHMPPDWQGTARIIGRPYDPAYLERLHRIAEGLPVQFVHDATDTDVNNAIRAARVLVAPSITPSGGGVSELLGITTLEALAMGTMPVVSTAGALQEIVEIGGVGAVFQENDAVDLARALTSVWGNLPSPQMCRQAARIFDWEEVGRMHLALYNELWLRKRSQR